jgi:hypothetical protein
LALTDEAIMGIKRMKAEVETWFRRQPEIGIPPGRAGEGVR